MNLRVLIAPLVALLCARAFAQTPRDFAVDLKANVSATVPRITLQWSQNQQAAITAQQIYRRLKGEVTWNLLATLSTSQTTYADTTALEGVEYEYWMRRTYTGITPNTALGYINAGVHVPMQEHRGTLLLVVDDTMITPLAEEITQLQQDLIGDGWKVQLLVAPRSGTAIGVKAQIKAAYDADPANVKQVYILGHVPVPFSGNSAWDGHSNHRGAWSADTYYGDMNGNWTDTSVNTPSTADARVTNVPGDGRFDQSTIPSPLELMVGRVDFANMQRAPSTAVSEATLLRRYLRRAHDFRHKQGAYADIQRRVLMRDGFGYFSGESFMRSGWAWSLTTVGRPPEVTYDQAPSGNWWTLAATNKYLMAHGNGGGSYETCSTVGATVDFGRRPFQAVFLTLFGSYFGDWDATNNFLRAPLAGNATGNGLALCSIWAGRPTWFMHHMGMGEPIGYATRQSMNSQFIAVSNPIYTPINNAGSGTHCGLMGDPSLRMHIVEPPRDLTATSMEGVLLEWSASTESNLLGYHVYRAPSIEGPFTRLTSTPVATPSFVDNSGTAGVTYTYMVRTLKLETAPGGTYENPSQGSMVSVRVNATTTATLKNPTRLTVTPIRANAAELTWQDNAPDAVQYLVQRKAGTAASFGTLKMLPPGSNSHTDTGPFANNTAYYYRVVAVGSSSNSPMSEVVSFQAIPGYFEFDLTTLKVNRTQGVASVGVKRFGGANGAVSVAYATANSSAVADTDYVATTGSLVWADGETGTKQIEVPLIQNVLRGPRQFRLTLSSPSSGTGVGTYNAVSILIEDPAVTLPAPWNQSTVGSVTNFSPAGMENGAIVSATLGGSGLATAATSESGRFIYQTRTGDGVLTARIPAALPAQSGSRYAAMVREHPTTGGTRMAGTATSSNTSYGSKFVHRATASATAVFTGDAASATTPRWVRITRAGDIFSSECSADGITWTYLGATTIPMSATAHWGLFHHSDGISSTTHAGNFQTAVFENVTIAPLGPPQPPATLTALPPSAAQVTLNWTAVSGVTTYRVERRTENGSFVQLGTTSALVTTYHDNSVAPDKGYAYRVVAINGVGSSLPSMELRVTTPPSGSTVPTRPSFLTGAANAGTTISLQWLDNSSNETGFQIERREVGGAFSLIHTTAVNAVTFVDSSTVPGTAYEYRVRAVNASGPSAYSLMVTATAGVPAGQSSGVISYASWLQENNQPTNLPADGDLDGDGIPNLLEYALGLSASSPNADGAPAVGTAIVGGNEVLTLTFARRIDASEVLLQVEAADSPAGPWEAIDPFAAANQVASFPNSPQVGWQTVVIKDAVPLGSKPGRFLRLRATQP